MPTPVINPPVGVKQSEKASISALAGGELVPALVPDTTSPTGYTNTNIPAALFGTAPVRLELPIARQCLQNQPPDPQVATGTFYAITGPWNAPSPPDPLNPTPDTTVYTFGLNPSAFASTGEVLVNGVAQAVKVDVVAGTWFILPANQQEAEGITYAALLAEANSIGVVRQKWFRITARTKGQSDVTVYFTDPADPSGWGDDAIPHLQPDGQSTRTRWAKYQLLTDSFEYDASLGGTGGGSSTLLTGTYTVRPADVTSPATALVIPVAGALAFGTVGVAVPGVSGQDILTPNSDYTASAGQLTISAGLNPPLQAGYEVHYAYLTGSVAAAGVTPAQLATVATTLPVTATRTADYTLQLADAGCMVPVASSATVTVTVPTNAAVPYPKGTILYVARDGTGAVIIGAASGVVVQTADGYKVPAQWTDVALHKRDLDTWVLKGAVN